MHNNASFPSQATSRRDDVSFYHLQNSIFYGPASAGMLEAVAARPPTANLVTCELHDLVTRGLRDLVTRGLHLPMKKGMEHQLFVPTVVQNAVLTGRLLMQKRQRKE